MTNGLTKAQIAAQEREQYIEKVREMAPAGSTIYGVVKHVSSSGMMRHIDLYVIVTGNSGKPRMAYLTGYAAAILGWKRTDSGALKVGGCGMNMLFHTVYSLSSAVWDGTPVADALREDGDGGYVYVYEPL